MSRKSTVDEIRERFDHDVERFSNLETGQSAAIDSPLMLDLISRAAAAVTPRSRSIVDIGCGAGNFTLKILETLQDLDCTLIDLSRPMLDRAHQRVTSATSGAVETIQADIREIDLGTAKFDVIVAAMVLHHLRTDDEWRAVFRAFHRALKPGGSIWVVDHIRQEIPQIQSMMTEEWGRYLVGLQGDAYRDRVFAYVAKEDTPHDLLFQTSLLREVGFGAVDVLHKNNLYAAYGAVK